MKSASNGGVPKSRLQVLHVHVLLVAPLGAGHMAQPGADQHEGRITVRETAYYTGAATDLPVQSFNDVISTDASPMFTRKWEIFFVSIFLRLREDASHFAPVHDSEFAGE